MNLLEILGEAIAPNNLAKIQVKIINKNNEIGDLKQKLEMSKNELTNLELLESYANQQDCQNHLIDNVLRVNCQESLEDIKIELGYDTILKDWNIERERAGIDNSTINARLLTIKDWLKTQKTRNIQVEIGEVIIDYLQDKPDGLAIVEADRFIDSLNLDASDDYRNITIELRKKQTQLLKDLASIDAQIFELELLTINA